MINEEADMQSGQFHRSSLALHRDKKAPSTEILSVPPTKTPSATIASPTQQHPGAKPLGNGLHASVSPSFPNNGSHWTRGVKRRYDDNSFEGYGDVYGDDEGEEGGGGREGEENKNKNKNKNKRNKNKVNN